MSQYTVRAVTWEAGEMTIAYECRTDLRDIAGTPVLRLATIALPTSHPSYADEVGDLHADARALLVDILEDYDTADPYEEPSRAGDDDADDAD